MNRLESTDTTILPPMTVGRLQLFSVSPWPWNRNQCDSSSLSGTGRHGRPGLCMGLDKVLLKDVITLRVAKES